MLKRKALSYLGRPGFSSPELSQMRLIELHDNNIGLLKELCINVLGPLGSGNVLAINRDASNIYLNLICPSDNNMIILDAVYSLRGQLKFNGRDNTAIIGRGWHTIKAEFASHGSSLYVGNETSIGGVDVWIQGEEKHVAFGQDCMLAWGVVVRTGDAHSVIDIEARTVTNVPASVTIGPHVWLAQEVLIFKGVEIGAGSVVSARSVVTKNLPAKCAAAGMPAKLIRTGVTWSRQEHADQNEIERVLKETYLEI